MVVDQITALISDVGFPIAVAAFFIVSLNGKLGRLTDSIEKLTRLIERRLKLTDDDA